MKLTTDQINYIDYVLKKQYTFENFEDLRVELLDHIASDVELKMQSDNMSFDDALPNVLHKWNDEIACDRNSYYNSVPIIVAKLWKKLDWKYNYFVLLLTGILCFGSMPFGREVWITYAMYSIACIGLVLGIYLLNLLRRNQFNTVLSMYAKNKIKLYVGLFAFALIANLALNYSDGDLLSCPALFGIIHTTLVFAMRTILMRKNIKIENQLLKVI